MIKAILKLRPKAIMIMADFPDTLVWIHGGKIS